MLSGSVEMRHHKNINPKTKRQELLKPFVIHKATEGDILGFDDMSMSPLTWFVSMQDDTELLYVSREDFNGLWKL